jgi:hypothetical protein
MVAYFISINRSSRLTGTVSWEWFGTWGKAIKEFFPQCVVVTVR